MESLNGFENLRVAIVGAGSIGVAFAVVFSRSGYSVHLHDPDDDRLAAAIHEARSVLQDLYDHGLITEHPDVVHARILAKTDFDEAVDGANLVQECGPERLEIKREIFSRLEKTAPGCAILATASSAIPISAIAETLATRRRCLVAHPGNPPYLIPVIEIVPAPFTSPEIAERAAGIYRYADLEPVVLKQEIEGFVFNRLQGAVLREAYCLVRDGIASVDDIDSIMRNGLGLRWTFMGPFETVDLNTRGGVSSHAEKMGPAYRRMGNQRGQDDPWTSQMVAEVERQRRDILPLDQWKSRGRWRALILMKLSAARKAALSQ